MGAPTTATPQRWLAWALAGVAGFVDCAGFVLLAGMFTAHMSGNTAVAAADIGTREAGGILPRLAVIVAFTVVVGLAFALVEVLHRRRARSVTAVGLVVEAALLAAFGMVGATMERSGALGSDGWRLALVGSLAAGAMATQDALLRRVGPVGVHTTFLTGVYMGVGVETARWAFARRDAARRPADGDAAAQRDSARAALAVFVPVLGSFAVGGVVGAYCAARIGFSASAVPLAVVLLLAGLTAYGDA